MNYDEQRKYLLTSRVIGAVLTFPLFALAFFILLVPFARADEVELLSDQLVAAAIVMALGCSIIYTPSYLHLSVTPNKPNRWQVRIRWRIAVAIAILSLVLADTWKGRLEGIAVATAVALLNLFAKKWMDRRWLPEFYFISDTVIFAACYADYGWRVAWFAPVAAVIFHVWLVMGRRHKWYALAVAVPLVVVGSFGPWMAFDTLFLFLTVLGTTVLVLFAEQRHRINREIALTELKEFTGRPAADVERMWQTSNQQLAANWEKAKLAPDDRAALAKWYADNSELYLFAISAYNLEYRRIKSNLFVLRYGRGHALDYGAGNGELVLEMARRGQRAAYYDVDGATLRFARWRAQQRGLEVEFFTEKPPLAALARERPFDTVFSFDVLEHIPDLAAELDFLSSLLAPGGQMVFDLPTGATKAHPMHLEHHLDFRKHLEAKGLRERKRWVDHLPFRKQEKFVFVK